MKINSLLVVAALTPGPALSQTYVTYKSTSCGDYMSDAKNQVNVAMASEYLRGFLSGHNLFSKRKQATQDLSNNTLGLWVEKYCVANPLSNIQEASPVLLVELTGPLRLGK
jgi:hypothetical protein